MITLTEADRAAERVLADIPAKTIATTDGPVTVARPWETYLIARFGIEETERMLTTNVGATQTEEGESAIMANKTTGHKKEGKFVFIKSLITGHKHTRSEIVALATKQFPHWDQKLLAAGVFSSRAQMRKAAGDDSIGWLPEPATEPAAPQ